MTYGAIIGFILGLMVFLDSGPDLWLGALSMVINTALGAIIGWALSRPKPDKRTP
jgi:hypothetical protein